MLCLLLAETHTHTHTARVGRTQTGRKRPTREGWDQLWEEEPPTVNGDSGSQRSGESPESA